ncbi:MAG: hypothetical protein NVS3B1_07940 [Marmoricola sp.]
MAGLARDRLFECNITRQIAGTIGVDVEPLNQFAEQRADGVGESEYRSDFPDLARNLTREACEELADARNYLVWRLDAHHRGLIDGPSEDVEQLQIGLRHVVLAFEAIRTIRR